MRYLSNETLKEIENLKSSGFARSTSSLRNYIRSNNLPYVKIFKVGSSVRSGKGSKRYTCKDIFGYSHFSHVYDTRHSENFVNYLVEIFLLKNPEPDSSIRKAFTHALHNNGLHWECCTHEG